MPDALHGFPTRAAPEELQEALTWCMATIAVLPHDLPGHRHHPGIPAALIRSWNWQPTEEWAICCQARTFC